MLALLLACVTARPVPQTMDVATPTPPRTLRTELLSEGPVEARLSPPDGADLVIFYGAEQHGDLGPCGCPTRPRGGLSRMAAYMDATQGQEGASPSIVVNSGQWLEDAMGLDGTPRADVPTLNRWMLKGLVALAPDGLNVSTHDVSGLSGMGGETGDLPLVSANVTGPGIAPVRIVQRGGLKIAITGITAKGVTLLETPGYTVSDPYTSARKVLDTLQADLVVLLSYQARESAKRLAEEGRVDLVVDTHRHRTLDEPGRVGSALWIRSHFQMLRLGELRLGLDEGKISWAVDRKIDLDDALPEDAVQSSIYKAARKELRVIEKQLYGKPRR